MDRSTFRTNQWIYIINYRSNHDTQQFSCINLFYKLRVLRILIYVNHSNNQKQEYKCFLDLIIREKISISNYSENEQREIFFLKDNGLVNVDTNGLITTGDKTKLSIVKELNNNEVINRWHYSPIAYPVFKEWLDKGFLRESDGLLSEPEAAYFDYLLNDAEFDNGLKIRNKYSHGNQQVVENENEHKNNYYILLLIATILAIKINDDFCLFEELQNEVPSNDNG